MRATCSTNRDPDYVVLGETPSYSIERITRGIRLIAAGARFIAANPDVTGPSEDGILPATGAVAALISKATGVEPYFVGKPNPLMMREALRAIGAHSENTAMVGDRMDTDVVAGMEAGLRTILVLTGVTTPAMVDRFPYRPSRIVDSVADLVAEIQASGAVHAVHGEAPEMTPASTRTLLDGNDIPLLGFGTWPLDDAEACVAVGAALYAGYRLIDTAAAVRERGGRRPAVAARASPAPSCSSPPSCGTRPGLRGARSRRRRGLERLGLDYVDLYLIHWPVPARTATSTPGGG